MMEQLIMPDSNYKELIEEIKLLRQDIYRLENRLTERGITDNHLDDQTSIANRTFKSMTTKQHVAWQLIALEGHTYKSASEIMGCALNTVRVHIRGIMKKLNTDSKQDALSQINRIYNQISEAEYINLTKGLPKNWAQNYQGGVEDPYKYLYAKSK